MYVAQATWIKPLFFEEKFRHRESLVRKKAGSGYQFTEEYTPLYHTQRLNKIEVSQAQLASHEEPRKT